MTCFETGGFSIFETASPTFKLRFTYMTGASTEEEVDRIAQRLTTDGLSEKITRPYLIVAGEDDNLSDIGFTYRHLNAVNAPKTLIVYEGANHGIHAASSGVLGPEPISTASGWLYDRAAGVALQSSHNVVDASGNVTLKALDRGHPLRLRRRRRPGRVRLMSLSRRPCPAPIRRPRPAVA